MVLTGKNSGIMWGYNCHLFCRDVLGWKILRSLCRYQTLHRSTTNDAQLALLDHIHHVAWSLRFIWLIIAIHVKVLCHYMSPCSMSRGNFMTLPQETNLTRYIQILCKTRRSPVTSIETRNEDI